MRGERRYICSRWYISTIYRLPMRRTCSATMVRQASTLDSKTQLDQYSVYGGDSGVRDVVHNHLCAQQAETSTKTSGPWSQTRARPLPGAIPRNIRKFSSRVSRRKSTSVIYYNGRFLDNALIPVTLPFKEYDS